MPDENQTQTLPEAGIMECPNGYDFSRLDQDGLKRQLAKVDDRRIWVIAEALRRGISYDEIFEITRIDRWFIDKLAVLVDMEETLKVGPLTMELLREAKRLEFPDTVIARLTGMSVQEIKEMRYGAGIRASFKMVDTCAAEFAAETPYYYSCFDGISEVEGSGGTDVGYGGSDPAKTANPANESHPKKKVLVLGSGPIRIGQGIEFDFRSVHSTWAFAKEGYETIKAIASFLAERYSSLSSPYGKVSNWIIGNEINNQQWNYVGPMDIDRYIQEYERAFRVFYTAIRSTNQNDRLFFSTDYNWIHEANGTTKYNAKDIIDKFADKTGAGGSMDWGLAYHPYAIPLTEPEFWDDDQTGLIKYDVSSPVVNLKNLNVLTDYMQSGLLRDRNGQVRHIILSEQGFTSVSPTHGENNDLQAAAIAYAYYIADSNPYIDAFIMSRQVDAPSEAAASMNFGLWRCDMNKPNDIVPTMRKKSWSVYKYIDDRKRTLETTEFAKSIIGIEKWSDVIPGFKWRSQEQ